MEGNLLGKFSGISKCCETFGRYPYPIKRSQAQVSSRVFGLPRKNLLMKGSKKHT